VWLLKSFKANFFQVQIQKPLIYIIANLEFATKKIIDGVYGRIIYMLSSVFLIGVVMMDYMYS